MGNIPLPALAVKPPEDPDVIGHIGKVVALRNLLQQGQIQQQSMQENEMKLQQERQMLADQAAARAAWSQANGDPDKYLSLLNQANVSPDYVTKTRESLLAEKQKVATLTKDDLDNQSKRNTRLLGLTDGLLATSSQGNPAATQQSYADTISTIKREKLMPDEMLAKLPPAYPGDDAINTMRNGLMTHDQFVNEAKFKQELQTKGAEAYGKSFDLMAQVLGNAKTQADWDKGFAVLKNAGTPDAVLSQVGPIFSQEAADRAKMFGISPDKMISIPVQKLAMHSWLAKNPGKTPDDFLKAEKSWAPMINMNLQSGLLSEDAKDAAADTYAFTGQLPAGIFRSPTMVAEILNRAVERHPDLDVAHNKAVYQSLEGSLKDMQKRASALDAFEKTAKKNVEQFMAAGKKIINTNSPILNMTLDKINRNIISNEERNAYDAAYLVASTESARVLANMGSAGVLSDNARKELGVMIDPHADMKSRIAAANIVYKDFQNRKTSFDTTIKDLQEKLRSRNINSMDNDKSGAPAAAPAAPAEPENKGFDINQYPAYEPQQ